MDERKQLELAIEAQEGLRGVVSDDVVDATIGTLQARIDVLDGVAVGEKRRKQVTVLFADVSGFTSASEDMDVEDLADSVNLLWDGLDKAITEFDGRIDKHIGDAVMGLWGTEEAREDDPEQAIRAALAMHEHAEELAKAGHAFPIRIGINTGPVVLGEMGTTGEYTAIGSTVNTAARLESAAPVGGILVSHDTYRHVRGVFSVQLQPPLTVKGVSDPLRTYVVNGVRPRAFRLQTRGVEGVETRMIGREAELEQLQDSFGWSIENQRLWLVEIVGDAGIGKSRLLYEFEDWLRVQPKENRLFMARADRPHQGVPYALTRDIFLTRFEAADNDPPDVVLSKLEAGVAHFLGESSREQAHLIGHLVGLDLSQSDVLGGIIEDAKQLHDRALLAVTQLFTAVSRGAPVVLLLEDVHWADQASMQLILHIAESCTEIPMLIVALARPSLFEHLPGWGDDVPSLTRLNLTRLTDDESGRLLDEVLQKVLHIPEAVRSQIVDNVDGNPFYVEELVKMLIEDEVIITGDDEWHMERSRITDLQVPATLTGVLQARLDRLPSRERDTMERASVVGRIFWDGSIPPSEVAGHRQPRSDAARELPQILTALRAKELIRENDTPDFAGTEEYIFKHAILHDVTYEGVLKSLRRSYHAWVAQWLAGRPEISAHPAMIAHHYELAELPGEAAHWYAEAAPRAQARYANDEAIDYYRKALRPETLDSPTRMTLSGGLADVLLLQARYDEALTVTESMLEHAQSTGDLVGQARALQTESAAHTRLGNNREALQTAQAAESRLRESGSFSPVELADVLRRVGGAYLRLGHMEQARTFGEEALELATEANHGRALRGILSLLGAHDLAVGQLTGAAKYFERGLEVTRALGDRIGEGRALLNLGEVARLRGDFEQAEAVSRQALSIQREMGDRDQQALTMSNIGAAYVGQEDYPRAISQLIEAGSEFTAAGAAEHISETCRLLAEAYLGSGEMKEALAEAQQALTHAMSVENPGHVGQAWRVFGKIAANLGHPIEVDWEGSVEPRDAVTCFRLSGAIFAEAGMETDRALALWDWASYELKHGDVEQGEARWGEARQILQDLGLNLYLARMDGERPPPA